MPNERDEHGYPKEGVHAFTEVTGKRDRRIVELYEGDHSLSTSDVGGLLIPPISGQRVCQRLEYWLALGADLPRWKDSRKDREYRDSSDTSRRRR